MPRPTEEPLVHISAGVVPTVAGQSCVRLGTTIAQSGLEPDGVWACWDWDGTTLTVRNDRLGFYPLYYCIHGDAIMVSPSIPCLLAQGAPRVLDSEGLSVFLRLGYFIGEHTPFLAIRALPPNAVLRWCNGNVRLQHTPPTATAHTTDRAQAKRVYEDLFQSAISRRQPRGRCAVPLSGGRDSRHIALALHQQGIRPHCLTMQDPHQDMEVQVAAQVAEALQLPATVLEEEPAVLAAEREKNERTNYCADEHGWYLPLAKYLAGHFDTVYDGIGGDVLSAGLFLDNEKLALMRAGRFRQMAEGIASNSEQAVMGLLAPAVRERFPRELAIDSLAREIARYADWPNPVGAFFLFNRTRREIALSPYRLLDQRLEVHAPYLDREVFDFLAGLPAEYFLDQQFHTETIAESYPQYAAIPYSRSISAQANWRLHRRDVAALASMLLGAHCKQLVSRSFLALRAVKSMLTPGYGREFILGHAVYATYLTQLAELADIEVLTLDPEKALFNAGYAR